MGDGGWVGGVLNIFNLPLVGSRRQHCPGQRRRIQPVAAWPWAPCPCPAPRRCSRMLTRAAAAGTGSAAGQGHSDRWPPV